MLKSDLIQIITDKSKNLPAKDVSDTVSLMLEFMKSSLSSGNRIEIRGFGTFCLHYRPPRRAHNPRTKKSLITEAKYSAHFKPGKELKERVMKSQESYTIEEI